MTILARDFRCAALALALVGAGAALAVPAEPGTQADPFYLGLLRDGRASLARGATQEAVESLRLACFGFLDTPPLLVECLVRLAMAQAAAGDRASFGDTFGRVAEIEERFGAYASADLTAEERAAFEGKVIALIPPAALAARPAFASLSTRREEAELAQMSERDRQRELERRAAAKPAEPRWRIPLAESELERARPAKAVEWLRTLPAAAAAGRVGCLRGQAQADLERCAEALPLLEQCAGSMTEVRFARPRLACLVRLERNADAIAYGKSLPAKVADQADIAKLRRLAERAQAKASPKAPEVAAAAPAPAKRPVSPRTKEAQAPPPKDPAPAPPKDAAPPSSREPAPLPAPREPLAPVPAAAPADRLTANEGAILEEALNDARRARKVSELEAALTAARLIADRHPALRMPQEVAGEIAYRASRFDLAVEYLGRRGGNGADRPDLSFYLAVARFETGDREGARVTLEAVLQHLERTAYVESYVKKILGP